MISISSLSLTLHFYLERDNEKKASSSKSNGHLGERYEAPTLYRKRERVTHPETETFDATTHEIERHDWCQFTARSVESGRPKPNKLTKKLKIQSTTVQASSVESR